MMKFKQFAVSLILASACAAAPALAETKIGFVNTERLLREAPLSVAAQKKLEREFATREQELQKLAKQARDLQAQLDKEKDLQQLYVLKSSSQYLIGVAVPASNPLPNTNIQPAPGGHHSVAFTGKIYAF